jgi:carbon storage regulator
MLVLSRRDGEEIVIGDDIVVKVLSIDGGRVRVGIEAPMNVQIRRSELTRKPRQINGPRWEPEAFSSGLAVSAS